MESKPKIGLFIPTLNAGQMFREVLQRIVSNNSENIVDRFLIIDSGSVDETIITAKEFNFEVQHISSKEFTHGLVRRRAAKFLDDCDYIFYMTQDVLLQPNALKELLQFILPHKTMLMAYGKQEVQLERSNIFEFKARQFNYPETSLIKTLADKNQLGVKTVFCSDAFAVYNRRLLEKIGNFPTDVIFEEDVFMASKGVMNHLSIGYCATAKIFHSHQYNLKQEYRRYKSIGAFHKKYPWIQKEFGSNESEGFKSVINEWKFLINQGKPYLIFYSGCRVIAKYLGYRMG